MDKPEERIRISPEDLEKLIAFKSSAIEVVKIFHPKMLQLAQSLEKVVSIYQPQIDALTKSISPAMAAVAKITMQHSPQMLSVLESLKRFEEFNTKLIEQHQASALILPPYFASLTIPEIYTIFEDENKSAIEIYYDYFNNPSHIEALLNSWSGIKFYKDRLPILEDALNANKDGKYTLSIPVFLSQIEGILCEILEVRDHGKAKGKLNKIKFEEDNNSSPFATPQSIADILINQVFQSSEAYQDGKDYPNRHSILHGKDKYYYEDKYASLRCIIILDSLRLEEFMNFNN